MTTDPTPKTEFEKQVESGSQGFFSEFWDFFCNNKKWWLTPIVLVLLLFGILVILASTGAAPFIYTLF